MPNDIFNYEIVMKLWNSHEISNFWLTSLLACQIEYDLCLRRTIIDFKVKSELIFNSWTDKIDLVNTMYIVNI